jgi:2'-5' RNA ligase
VAARHRLGVALLLDGPLADEVNGLRRGLGDRSLGRIDAHVTLVPPVNVRADDVPAALDIVRRAAQACGRSLTLTLGPPASFLPANPVVHLPVGGDLAQLRRLRDAVFTGPLHRSLSWPWVPHVTLADDASEIDAALVSLRHYQAVASVDRVVVLEERHGPAGRRWEPFADATLAPAVVVGRGGLDLTLVNGRVVDPAAGGLIADAYPDLSAGAPWAGGVGVGGGGAGGVGVGALGVGGVGVGGAGVGGASLAESGEPGADRSAVGAPIVVTGIVGATLVGVAVVWRTDAGGRIVVAVSTNRRGSGMGRQLLVHAEAAVRAAGWACPVLAAPAPAGFYAACSRWSVTVVA